MFNAKWLCQLLTPVKNKLCKHNVKDSFEFVERIRELDLTHKKMLSFDVSSLFTNVPLYETIEFLCQEISVNEPSFPIPVDLIKKLMQMH